MATATLTIEETLPEHILLEILSYLPVKDRCMSGRVCRRWRNIVKDNSLWRHVNLLPYQMDLRNMRKFVYARLSNRLQTLRIRGVLNRKTNDVSPPLSESMLEELKRRCPSLVWLHMEPGSVMNLPSADVLPSTLTHLTLKRCSWKSRWLKDCAPHFSQLVYLDLSGTVRLDNHDLKDVMFFTNLRKLKLDNCYRLSEPGLQEIAKTLTSLTTLSLRGCKTSDLIVHHMGRHLILLEELDLSASNCLTESCLPGLIEGLTKLKQLSLDDCPNMTAQAFSVLCKSQSLRKVSMFGNSISEDVVVHWRDEMPKCEIFIGVDGQ